VLRDVLLKVERVCPVFPLIAFGILYAFNPRLAAQHAYTFMVSTQILFTIWVIFEILSHI